MVCQLHYANYFLYLIQSMFGICSLRRKLTIFCLGEAYFEVHTLRYVPKNSRSINEKVVFAAQLIIP